MTTTLRCTDTDTEHVHDEGSCCECASTEHCCGDCPVFVHPVPGHWITFDPRNPVGTAYRKLSPEAKRIAMRDTLRDGWEITLVPLGRFAPTHYELLHTRTGRLLLSSRTRSILTEYVRQHLAVTS